MGSKTADQILSENPDVQYDATTGKFYKFVSSGLDWNNAQQDAQSTALTGVRGQLVTIFSATENEFVSSTVAQGQLFWMGASDQAVEGAWRWYDGSTQDAQFWSGDGGGSSVGGLFSAWAGGEPNDQAGEDVAVGNWDPGARTWNDLSAQTSVDYVVEWNAAAVLNGHSGPPGTGGLDLTVSGQLAIGQIGAAEITYTPDAGSTGPVLLVGIRQTLTFQIR